ncbi:FecR family protein [Methylomonas albis]|uniref:FecR family protein n=1 Tax=Methylomonas albis TaxID=1854563 RepID=A0ABR9CY53_9GAMM|nr:FecR family protein [Methylomonas albis]MBD9355827.1 FecR family protein [Methylomonas albis]
MQNHPNDQDRIAAEAADWVARLGSGEVSDQDRKHFNAWVAQSPEHRALFFELRKHWQSLGNAAEQWQPLAKAPSAGWRAYASAAVLLLTLGLASWHYQLGDYLLADHYTAISKRSQTTLTDGSTLYLNTDSAVAVEFTGQKRQIRLLHGEAEFSVAHDRNRPFTVSAGPDRITALGTDFSVYRNDGLTTVTVFENTVQVEHGNRVIGVLNQGQQQFIDSSTGPSAIERIDSDDARAWRDGKLVFTARPLREVIDQINRHRPGKLLLLNEVAARYPVSGVFKIAELDGAVNTIAETLHLNSMQINGLLTAYY